MRVSAFSYTDEAQRMTEETKNNIFPFGSAMMVLQTEAERRYDKIANPNRKELRR